MPSLNKIMLIGNLTRDPELRHTPKGTAVAELGLAINRDWKDDQGQKQSEVTFLDVTLWGRQAEIAQQYLTKGKPVYIEGRLQLETWDDKETGKKRSKLKVVGEQMQFLGSSKDSGDSGERQEPQSRPPQQRAQQATPADECQDDDDIPF
jgi:single-strand DNA-binding protein